MPTDIKYTGTQVRWPEIAVTGKQSVWFPGQEDTRDDAEATQLLATGLFQKAGAAELTTAEANQLRYSVSGAGKLTPADVARWPMVLPTVMASPPTITLGTANAASAISGSVFVDAFTPGAFDVIGGRAQRLAAFNGGFARMGYFPYKTSAATTVVQFKFDTQDATGRFEISSKGNGSPTGDIRILVRNASTGRWEYVAALASITHPSDGNGYLDLVTLGAPGEYQIRLEFSGSANFGGIRAHYLDGISATGEGTQDITALVCDSYGEPTIAGTAGTYHYADGFPILMCYLQNTNFWAAGSGGTGYLNPGSGGKVKFRDRLAQDILPIKGLKRVVLAGGINDYSFPGATPSLVADQVTGCIADCRAAGVEVEVWSPFWPKGAEGFPADWLQFPQAIKAAALAAGVLYVDLLDLGPAQFLIDYGDANWQGLSTVAGNTGDAFIRTDTIPAYFLQANVSFDKWYIRIGSGATQIVRKVTNISGAAGNWKLDYSGSNGVAFPIGTPVVLCGPSFITGSGTAVSPAGNGNSDRFTGAGTDTTHPTKSGHRNLARVATMQRAKAIIARGY